MINIPKDLSDIEVGIYKSGYSYWMDTRSANIFIHLRYS